jgi:excisionase family DNA binding protein
VAVGRTEPTKSTISYVSVMTSEEPGLFLTVRETAKRLGVHENTIRNWVKTGVIVSARLPGAGAHRFAREEVERLQRRRGQAVSSIAPLRRAGGELVTANELDAWARARRREGCFPGADAPPPRSDSRDHQPRHPLS